MENRSQQHKIELALESGMPIEVIAKLYDEAFLRLATGAKTNAYLHILVKRRVQEQIRRLQKSGSSELPLDK